MTFDSVILHYLNDLANGSAYWYGVAFFSAEYLFILVFLLPVIVFYLDHNLRHRFIEERVYILALLSVVVATAIGFILSVFIYRARPPLRYSDIHLILAHLPDTSSFPSAHSWITSSFATVFVIRKEFRDLGWALLFLSIVIAISRVMVGAHYPTDVIAGLILGISSAILVVYGVQPLSRWLFVSRNQGKANNPNDN